MGLSDGLVPDLPDLAAQKLVQNFTDSSIFQLVSLASVCSLWRTFVKELEITHLSLETTLNVKGDASVGPMLRKFRKLSVEEKTRFYEAVTLLLKRQKSVLCTGEAISDKIVISLANTSLQRLTLEGCTKVTDYSLSILLLRCPDLQELHLKNMSAICGAFLPAMLLQGRCLRSLSLQNLSGPDWSLPFEAFSNNNSLPSLKTLTLENVRLDKGSHSFFRCFPRLKYLSIDSCPACVRSAANYCPELEEVVLNVDNSRDLDNCLTVLVSAPSLRILQLSPFTFKLTHNQMRVVGILNLTELRLESPSFKHQPLNRIAPCHLDNDGVKVLVDTICQRKLLQPGRQPFKLSLCGAASISHDAVSALLRLPLLSGLSLDGCSRISSIDKMRLIAKVKAGRELLDGKSRQKTRREAFGLLDHCRSI